MQPTNQETFAELLTEAIHIIKRRQAKPISVVQDELMYAIGRQTGNPIEYWRKGHIPGDQAEFARLARELMARGKLSRSWLERFWGCTDYLGLGEVVNELFAAEKPGQAGQASWLPQKPYQTLIGRTEQVDGILACLAHGDRNLLVAIDGMGGIGKSALAYEVVSRALDLKLFDAVVWVADDAYSGQKQAQRGLTYEEVLNTIGARLGAQEVAGQKIAQKEDRVRALLHMQKVLVVLDNLEIAADPQQEIAQRLHPLLGVASRAMMMSRQRFLREVYHVHLPGLAREDAAAFIRQEAGARGIAHLNGVSLAELHPLIQQTGGSPLALKLSVGQLGYQPMPLVLARFQNVRVQAADTDEYGRFYRAIFLPSWGLLSLEGKQLLVSLTHFAAGVGGTFEAIKAASGLDTDVLADRVDELWQLAFLEVGDSSLNQIRYYLHALTRHFVLSDIVEGLR